jgi:hypothetical protein
MITNLIQTLVLHNIHVEWGLFKVLAMSLKWCITELHYHIKTTYH